MYTVIAHIFWVVIFLDPEDIPPSTMWLSKSSMSPTWISDRAIRVLGDSWNIHHIAIIRWIQRWDFPLPLHWQFHFPTKEYNTTLVLPNWHQLSITFVKTGKKNTVEGLFPLQNSQGTHCQHWCFWQQDPFFRIVHPSQRTWALC